MEGKPLTKQNIGQESRYNGEDGQILACLWCGVSMAPHWSKKYCSDKCRLQAWQARTYKKFVAADGSIILLRESEKGKDNAKR